MPLLRRSNRGEARADAGRGEVRPRFEIAEPPAPPPAPQIVPAAPVASERVDVPMHWRVLWRFKFLVLAGVLLGIGLAFLAMFRVELTDDGRPAVAYRASEEWVSYARLHVTRPGAQIVAIPRPRPGADPAAEAQRLEGQLTAEQRLTGLAIFYARLVDSDAVQKYVLKDGPVVGAVQAAPVPALDGESEVLPIISIAGIAPTPETSLELTSRTTEALRTFIIDRQDANNVPPEDRVVLDLVKKPGGTILLTPRSKTLPLVVFVTIMVAVIAIAFILENIRPRTRPAAATTE